MSKNQTARPLRDDLRADAHLPSALRIQGKGGKQRIVPMLEAAQAALGAVPLAIGVGPGSELRRPLGIAIIGGLAVSQVLTLYTTPIIYLLLDRLHRRLWGKGQAGLSRGEGSAAPVPAE